MIVGVVAALLLSGGGSTDDSEGSDTASSGTQASADGGQEGSGSAVNDGTANTTEEGTPGAAGPADRAAIVAVLQDYGTAYSDADLAGMAALFTPEVERHGLSPSGCLTVSGKGPVLAAYRAQFGQNGPIPYELVGLGHSSVDLFGEDEARVATDYSIPSANNSGAIVFSLEERGGAWRITKVDATCNPSSS